MLIAIFLAVGTCLGELEVDRFLRYGAIPPNTSGRKRLSMKPLTQARFKQADP